MSDLDPLAPKRPGFILSQDDPSTSPAGFRSFRFGPGVLGKTSTVAISVFVMVAIAVHEIDTPWMQFTIVLFSLVLAVGYFIASFWYADRHPGLAALSSSDSVRYAELVAAKEPRIIEHQMKNTGNISPPAELLNLNSELTG
jgi:hypothetical protein